MECTNETRRRRLPVSRDPAHLQVLPEAHSSTDFRTNISRLEEATRRLNSYVTSQLNSEAVAAELRFIEPHEYRHNPRSLQGRDGCSLGRK